MENNRALQSTEFFFVNYHYYQSKSDKFFLKKQENGNKEECPIFKEQNLALLNVKINVGIFCFWPSKFQIALVVHLKKTVRPSYLSIMTQKALFWAYIHYTYFISTVQEVSHRTVKWEKENTVLCEIRTMRGLELHNFCTTYFSTSRGVLNKTINKHDLLSCLSF